MVKVTTTDIVVGLLAALALAYWGEHFAAKKQLQKLQIADGRDLYSQVPPQGYTQMRLPLEKRFGPTWSY